MSRPQSAATVLRPWTQFLSLSTVSIPISLSESTDRLFQNLRYFSSNYALLILVLFSLSLLPHPLSLLLFLLLSLSFLHLYLLRTDPVEILGITIPENLLLGFIGLMGLIGMFWARAWGGLVMALILGGVIVGVHAVMKAPEEDVDGSPYGELLSDLDGDGARGEYVRV